MVHLSYRHCAQARQTEGHVAKKTKTVAKEIANEGVESVRSVAADALGAAASVAAGVVLTRVAEGLGAGSKKLQKTTPGVQQAADSAVKRGVAAKTVSRRKKKRIAKKRTAKNKKKTVTKKTAKKTTSRRKKR
jgi:hypothetical protein